MKIRVDIKKIFSPITILLIVVALAKLVSVNFHGHKKSFYQNYDPDKIALLASSDDSQNIEIPPSKAIENGHTNNNNEFKLKSIKVEQESVNVFNFKDMILKNSFLYYSRSCISVPIYISNRSILI